MVVATGATDKWERLVLVGFMGAGKSTVASILAPLLHRSFVDSDQAIEQQTSSTISQLFDQRGEQQFRIIEAKVISELLTKKQVVISLGGGSLENSATRQLLQNAGSTCVIHLEAPLSILLERCREQAPTRPLLQDEPSLVERHANRMEHYRTAQINILTTGKTPQAVVEEILHKLAAISADDPVE